MEHHFEDTRQPLQPSRKSSLNAKCITIEEHKRRKSSMLDDLTAATQCFDASTVSTSPIEQTFTFSPISSVLRAHVPLSWLSGSNSFALAPATLLKARITSVQRWEYHILIAKLATSAALFALERVDIDVYICQPLQSWVKPQWVEQAAFGAAPAVDLALLLQSQSEKSHSRKVSTTSNSGAVDQCLSPISPKIPKNRKGHIARLSILESRDKTEEPSILNEESPKLKPELERVEAASYISLPAASLTQSGPESVTAQSCSTAACDSLSGIAPDTDAVDEAEKLVDQLSSDYLQRQYLETLYVSKTSLAFYAKGPLSRARARARMPNASRSLTQLAEFYRDCIIPVKKLDLKYRVSIQNKVTSLMSREESCKSTNPQRKKKHVKLGKDGLWPLEHEYIEQWWRGRDLVSASSLNTEAHLAEMKQIISKLRMRETEMQIILIVEVIALEGRDTSNQQTGRSDDDTPPVKVESIDMGETALLNIQPTKKKKRNLKSELDFLVDRLCIWHSIGIEGANAFPDVSQNSGSSVDKVKDRLRDFCKDVIVPFYGAKLPDQCQAICARTGAQDLSPRRSKGGRSTELVPQVPGAVVNRERASNKRDLQRVLSEDQSIRHASPPALSRSATLPTPVNAKRETSERPVSRRAMQKSVSFSNREVDLVADARATAAKRRKLDLVAAQKRELDAAIETLKRPNRSTVAKSFMDEMEQRTNENRSTVKKVEPIQISATPRRCRIKSVEDDDYDLPPMQLAVRSQEDSIVFSSAIKPRGLGQIPAIVRSSAKKRAVISAIHDTPSRAVTTTCQAPMDGEANPHLNEAAGGVSSATLVASTPSTSRLRVDLVDGITKTPMRMNRSLRPVLLTPMKKSEVSIEEVFRDAPEIPERAGKTMDRAMGSKLDSALYDSLGWNDDYDL